MFTTKNIEVTKDITLGVLKPRDAGEIFALIKANHDHLQRWLDFPEFTKEVNDTLKFIKDSVKKRKKGVGYDLSIRYQGKIVGLVGLNQIDSKNRIAEIGYWLVKSAEGNGIMTKSVSKLIDVVFDDPMVNRLELIRDVDNNKSGGVPERLGFMQEGKLRGYKVHNGVPRDFFIYSLLRSDPRP